MNASYVAKRELVEITAYTGKNRDDLFFYCQGRELRLLQQLGETRSAIEQALRCRIEIGAELGERRHLAILGKLELDRARHLLHGLDLCRRADPRNRQAWRLPPDESLVEEIGLKKYLPSVIEITLVGM